MFKRVIAVDWSGNRDVAGQRRAIQRCIVENGDRPRVTYLGGGLTRKETVQWLVDEHARDALIGFDFAFSFPASFLPVVLCDSWRAVLSWARKEGEAALTACEEPFWGRPGKRCTRAGSQLRWTDEVTGLQLGRKPKPIFQIGGAGAAGSGSLRGMPLLLELAEAGFSVWPFDGPLPGGQSAVVEIYPRWFTGRVVKSNMEARRCYLDSYCQRSSVQVPRAFQEQAAAGEDAFDALVSAIGMTDFVRSNGFNQYGPLFYAHPAIMLEGWILGPTPPR